MAHTPAPWHIALPGGPQGPFYGLVNSAGNVVATQIVGEANARLIATAPEMADALREFANPDNWEHEGESTWIWLGFPPFERPSMLLAKAEGREP